MGRLSSATTSPALPHFSMRGPVALSARGVVDTHTLCEAGLPPPLRVSCTTLVPPCSARSSTCCTSCAKMAILHSAALARAARRFQGLVRGALCWHVVGDQGEVVARPFHRAAPRKRPRLNIAGPGLVIGAIRAGAASLQLVLRVACSLRSSPLEIAAVALVSGRRIRSRPVRGRGSRPREDILLMLRSMHACMRPLAVLGRAKLVLALDVDAARPGCPPRPR
mmetsp:Transcript_39485/g.126013  ORF Transcript_39485/g.126013 Transcript_39485/m.126013 type:complete len:223 (-) Transcript_39485:1142-1810(-)